jgi:hypothetical protein
MKTKTWKAALGVGLPYTVFMIIIGAIQYEGFTLIRVISSILGGIFFGLCFVYGMKYLGKKLYKKTVVEIQNGEKIIKEGGANHFRGIEGVGGRLVLTNKRLVFKSHKLNIQNHEDNFHFQQIEKVQATKTMGILSNGLLVSLTNNDKHRFVVEEPDHWVKEIIDQMNVTS